MPRHTNVKSGVLAKRGHQVKSWKLRWFDLSDGSLKYYDCQGGKLKGKVSLAPGTMAFEWSEGLTLRKRRANCFCVQTQASRRLICQAGSPEERSEWIDAIMLHVNGQQP